MNGSMSCISARSRALLVRAMLIAPLLSACGGSNGDATGPSASCALTAPRGSLTAQVNGAAFTSNFATAATIQNSNAQGPNIVQVSGAGCVNGSATRTQQIIVTLGRLTPITVGTYQLSAAAQGQPTGSGYSGIGAFISSSNQWYSNRSDAAGEGSGSITFTTITATRLTGTFSLVLAAATSNASGNTGRVTVANGTFDIPTQ